MYKKITISISLIAIALIVWPHRAFDQQRIQPVVAGATVVSAVQTLPKIPVPQLVSASLPPIVGAKAILAVDLATGTTLYRADSDEQLPIASLTKLMTAMVVLDHVNKDQVVTITAPEINIECTCMGLKVGEQITVENLLKGMLIPSDNDAAQTLATYVGGDQENFVNMMNEKAAEMGLTSTHYSTPVGLDTPGNYSTASDLSRITQEFLKYTLLAHIVDTRVEDVASVDGTITHHLESSNKLLLDNPEVVGVKTGFTDDAQGNLIVKIDHGNAQILTIVLNTPNREDDSQKLIDWIFQAYKW